MKNEFTIFEIWKKNVENISKKQLKIHPNIWKTVNIEINTYIEFKKKNNIEFYFKLISKYSSKEKKRSNFFQEILLCNLCV